MTPGSTILLTCGRAPATLHLARLLKAQGYRVVVADTFANNITALSTAVSASYTFPSPVYQAQGFIDTICEILRKEKVQMLIPTCEETFHVSKHQAHFEAYCSVFCADLPALDELHHKFRFNQLLKAKGLPAPLSFLVHNLDDFRAALPKLPAGFVLKPAYSRFADKVIINDLSYLRPDRFATLNVSIEQPWLAQQFIDGTHFGSFSIVAQGALNAQAVYPLQCRIKNGSATYFESVPIPEIESIVRSLSEGYNGFISFDFIHSNIDGKYYAIECNPRLTSGVHLFDKYDRIWDYLEGTSHPRPENSAMLSLGALAYSLLEGKTDVNTMLEQFSMMAGTKDAVFQLSDPQPFFAQFSNIFHFWKKSRTEAVSLLAATTSDIEWNGGAKL